MTTKNSTNSTKSTKSTNPKITDETWDDIENDYKTNSRLSVAQIAVKYHTSAREITDKFGKRPIRKRRSDRGKMRGRTEARKARDAKGKERVAETASSSTTHKLAGKFTGTFQLGANKQYNTICWPQNKPAPWTISAWADANPQWGESAKAKQQIYIVVSEKSNTVKAFLQSETAKAWAETQKGEVSEVPLE